MSLPVWGQLPKSQEDPEKIEEAIQRIVEEHNEDPEAHLGEGQSLQSHKASEIIDHLVASIVADKIKNFEVGREKLALNKVYIRPNFESLDAWLVGGTGAVVVYLGGVKIRTDSVIDSYEDMRSYCEIFDVRWDTKNAYFETIVRVYPLTNVLAIFVAGNPDQDCLGFKIEDGVLYAFWVVGTTQYTEVITGVDLSLKHTFKVVATPGVKLEFYVDEVLKITKTTNLPTATSVVRLFYYYLKTKTSAFRYLDVLGAVYSQDR